MENSSRARDSSPPRRKPTRDLSPPRKSHSRDESSSKNTFDADLEPPRMKATDKMTSGHSSGLQSGSEFGKNEKRLRETGQMKLSSLDSSVTGKGTETVYRKDGKKMDMGTEFMKSQAIKEGKKLKIEEAQYEWGLGTVQLQQAQVREEELKEIAAEPFARMDDDPKLEQYRRDVIRDGDPMALYITEKKDKESSKKQKEKLKQEKKEEKLRKKEAKRLGITDPSLTTISSSSQKNRKPLYTGPPPPPNRFGIHPGYRWDGIDRGSLFEKKIARMKSNVSSTREDEYKWSVSDM